MNRSALILALILVLAGCSGGVSGLMSSSPPGYWQIYRIKYQPGMNKQLEQPVEAVLEDVFFKLGFKQKRDWGRPLLADARVTGFTQRYQEQNIYIKLEITRDTILIMSTSYSSETREVFKQLQRSLREIFGVANVESCYGFKDLEGRTCLNN